MSTVHLRKSVSKSDKQEPKQRELPDSAKDGEPTPTASKLPLKVAARVVVILSMLTIVYYNSKDEKMKIFAQQKEVLPGRGQIIDCSDSYKRDLDKFEGCLPEECGRYVTDKLVNPEEADQLLKIAKKGLAFGGSVGGASILDLHSGALSKGERFVNIYKIPEARNLYTESDFNVYRIIKSKIQHAIAHNFNVQPNNIYLTHPTFFSEITAKKAVTLHDEYWHPHVDKETYKSFHYTSLLYLNDYGIDFKGGRFVFIDEKYNRTVEPRKARVSMFTSGEENPHYVEKIDSGVRYAMTISFTCDKEYAIDDPSPNKYA